MSTVAKSLVMLGVLVVVSEAWEASYDPPEGWPVIIRSRVYDPPQSWRPVITEDTFIDATGGEWSVGVGHSGSIDNRYPVLIDRTSATVKIINGFMNGDLNQEVPWATPGTPDEDYVNSAALTFRNFRGTAKVLGWRFERVWDGFRSTSGEYLIQDCYFASVRDDAIEAEWGQSGIIRNSLFDGVFVAISAARNTMPDRSHNLIEFEDTLVRMKGYPYRDPDVLTHLGAFKWVGNSPGLSIDNSIFAMEVPDHMGQGRLRTALRKIRHIEDSYWLNLSDTPFPADYPDVEDAGFTVIQGAEARAFWLVARARWVVRENARRTEAGLPLLPVADPDMPPFSLIYAASPGGRIVGEAIQYESSGSAVTALPDPGFRFVKWSDGSTANPRQDQEVAGSLFFEAEFALELPFTEDFEGVQAGTRARRIPGWRPHGRDFSEVMPRELGYEHAVGFPLPDRPHSQVLQVGDRFRRRLNRLTAVLAMDPGEYPRVYLDQMIRLQAPTRPPDVAAFIDDEVKYALYLNEEEALVLFHGGADGDTASFTVLETAYVADTWARLTVSMDLEGPDGDIPFFRVFLDGAELSGGSAGFPVPSADPADYSGGAWFRFANYSQQQLAGHHRVIQSLNVAGGIQIDDVVVTPFIPEAVIPTHRILSRLDSSRGQMDPPGEWVGDGYALTVEGGAPAGITYTAAAFYEIESLVSDAAEVTGAVGEEQYRWRTDAVTADVLNDVAFTDRIWGEDVGGDGRTPLWWADRVGYAAGSALSVFEGFLINQVDLDEPFRIVALGLNAEQRPFVEWHSSGPERGRVTVKSGSDLMAGLDEWMVIDGTTAYDDVRQLNRWVADDEADPQAFYHVIITD